MGVKLMTFDSEEEAINISKIFPDAELILRIAVVETEAPCPMGLKFGAPKQLWDTILDVCIKLKMIVRGVSFHVGSGGCSFLAYKSALIDSQAVFELALSRKMARMDYLDIGGGFSTNSTNYSN